MLKAYDAVALAAAKNHLAADAPRAYLPADCSGDLAEISARLSATLSSDGTRFVAHVRAGRARVGHDATATLTADGVVIEVERLPETGLTATGVDRFALLLLIASNAYLEALQRDGWDNLDAGEEPWRRLAHAAASAPPEAVAAARRWVFS